jgi:putative ABC transport system permease protein
MRLRNISVMQALKSEHASLSASGGGSYFLGLLFVFGLIYWLAGDSRMAGILSVSLSATLVLLALATLLLLWILRRIPLRRLNVWVMGLRHILRHPWQNLIQILAFGVSIMAVVLLTMLRNDLLSLWQDGLPEDIPNRFVINIQGPQKDAIQSYWQDKTGSSLDFYPLVQARISQVKGQPVAGLARTPKQHGLLDHAYRLSWQSQLNSANTLVAGQWFSPRDAGKPLLSVEQGMAETLGLTLGDSLTFTIEGREIELQVASIREVKWDSFQPNFYVLLNPGVLPEQNASNITSVYVADNQESVLHGLINRFPNLTVINASDIISHVRSISAKVSMAIEFMFALTLVSGAVLLLAAIRVSYEQRKRETAIQRALGVSRQRVLRAIAAEFALIGVLAGIIGMFFSSITATIMAQEIFQRSYVPSAWYWIISLCLAAALTATLGLLSLRPVLRVSPMRSLKSA